jgi:hypothetical protein
MREKAITIIILKTKKNMKNSLIVLLVLLYIPLISAQDTTKIVPKQVKKTDNYTIQRLIIHNSKGEILMQRNKFGWFTPSIRSNENQSLREGLDSLATAIGIIVAPVRFAGIFTYKYDGLSDHNGLVSYRTHYTTTYKSGELIQPKDAKDTTRQFKWLPIKEALDIIGMAALKAETTQIITHPDVIWGGSFLLKYKDEKLESIKMVEDFYALSGQ